MRLPSYTKQSGIGLLVRCTICFCLLLVTFTFPAPQETELYSVSLPRQAFVLQMLRAKRDRPKIVENSLVADNGFRLRGETPRWNWTNKANDDGFWQLLRNYHMNAVRILCYRPPQNYPGGCGWDCPDLTDVQGMLPALDTWVAKAAEH